MDDSGGARNSKLILAAMIFAVAMTFIDMTIVAIAVPSLQEDLSLSSTGVQWIVNGYLLSLSALFAFGGRLADIAGHRSMVVLGVIVFATASALCGATPTGSLDEAWIVTFRVIQGAGAAIMFPAALAIVLGAFPVRERGRAMALFFAITGGLTAIGPLAGGYLVEVSWRAIFWVNIPVAIVALVLTAISKPENRKQPAPLDYRGAVLVSGGMGLAVLGLQQSSVWGWGSPVTWVCIAAGLALLAAFVLYELRVENPLVQIRTFADRAFAADNAILFLLMIPFVPLFFFASMYAQISLGESASETGLYLLIFFAGFAVASQWGGSSTASAPAGRWSSAARWRRSASISGRDRYPTSRSARSGSTSCSPEPGSASYWPRRTPTRSTGSRPAATARRPGSPRRSATSAPASAWRCWARS
jgi:MFS family permease